MAKSKESRIEAWAKANPTTLAILLVLGCVVALAAIFYFVVFSDFGGSADFIYNQF